MINIAPLKTWVVDILEDRENNPQKSVFKMPFVIMSSGAKIYKSPADVKYKNQIREKIQQILLGKEDALYNGCIITNHINPTLNYQSGETILGYDFDGKLIKTPYEKDRLISTPIIESVDVSSENSGILRQANVKIRCFSLKQFELFELFFCKAQMDILLEWGEGSEFEILKKQNIIEPKNNYTNFVGSFRSLCKPSTDQFKGYLDKCKDSNGTYDRMAGKLTNYQYTIDSNGTYDITLEISQGNEYNLALPPRFESTYTNIATATEKADVAKNTFPNWKNQIYTSLKGLNKDLIDGLNEKDWKNDFFNWRKVNEDKEDESASNRKYLSLRFVLKILMNNIVSQAKFEEQLKFKVPNENDEFKFFDVGGASDEIVPISIHKNILSPTDDVLFPTETAAKITLDKSGQIIYNTKSTEDNKINGKSIFVNKDVFYLSTNSNDKKVIDKIKLTPKSQTESIGNALNIFIDFGKIGDCWERAISRADFLAQILDLINENSFGMLKLRLGTFRQDQDATVIDTRLYLAYDTKPVSQSDTGRKEYRFKPGSLKSNVREFNYNFELPNFLAGATLYNANAFLANVKKAKKDGLKVVDPKKGLLELKPTDAIWKAIDYSSFGNSDGLFAINQIQYEQLGEVIKSDESINSAKKDDTEDNKTLKASNLEKIQKFKVGKLNYKIFAIKDVAWLYNKFYELKEGETYEDKFVSTPTPIDITVKIDGISGITFGELIKVDGVPEILNKVGHFYITDIKHNVDSQNGWTTTLVASFRWNSKE